MVDSWENFPERCQNCYWLSVMVVGSTGAWFDCYAYVGHPPKDDDPPRAYIIGKELRKSIRQERGMSFSMNQKGDVKHENYQSRL